MRFRLRCTLTALLAALPLSALSQQGMPPPATVAAQSELPAELVAVLPNAPLPQSAPAPDQPLPRPSDTAETQRQTADEQLKQQKSQRVVGLIPAFNVSYRSDAVSLNPLQKFDLAYHTVIDPYTFATAFLVAGYREALDDDTGFRWGPNGYLRRSGAAYLDTFDGTMIGNAILPSLLHQDPRYFRLGHGTVARRILYSASTNIVCKHDKTGRLEPNYSNVLGNIAAGGLSNLYYPPGNSGIGQTITNGLVVTAEGAITAMFNEFWPDISRHYFHFDPTHGQDARVAAIDAQKPPSFRHGQTSFVTLPDRTRGHNALAQN